MKISKNISNEVQLLGFKGLYIIWALISITILFFLIIGFFSMLFSKNTLYFFAIISSPIISLIICKKTLNKYGLKGLDRFYLKQKAQNILIKNKDIKK